MQPQIILLVGLPASGKSTWAKKQGIPVLSSDAMRLVLLDDETALGFPEQVFGALRYLLAARLRFRRPITAVDATNLSVWEREPYLKLAQENGAMIEVVFFDVSLAECKRRNRLRSRHVPDAALEAMSAKLVRPSLEEGFLRVTVVGPGTP